MQITAMSKTPRHLGGQKGRHELRRPANSLNRLRGRCRTRPGAGAGCGHDARQHAVRAPLPVPRVPTAAAAHAAARRPPPAVPRLQAPAPPASSRRRAAAAADGDGRCYVRAQGRGGERAAGEEHECVVCMVNSKTRLLRPCGHVCVCDACAKQVKACPVCRSHISEAIRAYV